MSSQTPRQANPKSNIIILGAGITGLSTALCLLTSPQTSHHTIILIATHLPGDLSPSYTSPWAGGDWRSHASLSDAEADLRAWDKRTYEAWTDLLSNPLPSLPHSTISTQEATEEERAQTLGLAFNTLRYFWGSETAETVNHDGSGLWFSSLVKDFTILDLEQEKIEGNPVPKDAVWGVSFRSMTFDPPRYLNYLLNRIKGLGARIVQTNLDVEKGLPGVVRGAKHIFLGEEWKSGTNMIGDVFAVINCAGLSARRFLEEEEAGKLFPIRGQTVLAKGFAMDASTYVSIPGTPVDEMLYVIPRPGSNTTILGGCKQANSFDESVDGKLSKRIMERVKMDGLAEELRTGEGGGFEVLREQVGFRPGRKGGPRVEVEEAKVEGVWVVHSYGHGGGGYQASVGCAERVVELICGLE